MYIYCIYIYIIYRIPDAFLISGCVSGCLPCAPLWNLASGGSKISNKNTFSGLGLGILPPAGQRSQKNTSREKTHAYIAHIRPCRPHIGPYYENFLVDPKLGQYWAQGLL